ncbi:MAG: polysaccharide deacetylase family protein [Candidatus Eiseniibacteriota bacterium]
MSLLHRPEVRRLLSRHLLCRVEGVHGRFALTFDDGPSPRNTPKLLEVLERRGARATFFLLAGHVRRHPHLVRALVAAGHELGVHGRHHLWPAALPDRCLAWEVQHTAAAIEAAAGVRPGLYRAPFGVLRPGQARRLRALGYEPVLGDIYPADVRCRRAEPIVARVMPRLVAGSIVILHDASVLGDRDRGATIAAVEGILGEAARRGLEPSTVSGMVRDAGDGGAAPGARAPAALSPCRS